MNDCWQILGLDPASATEREVKSAYAKLIKTHRPDEDPEGFQRVRQAMETAIAILRSGPAEVTSEMPVEAEADQSPPLLPPAARPELIEAELAVMQAREKVNPTLEAGAMLALQPLCLSLESGPEAIKLWHESLHRVTGSRINGLVWWIKTEQLIVELEHNAALICHAVLDHCESQNDMSLALGLGSAIIEQQARLANFEAGIVALRTAILTGFLVPANVPKLCNFAFPHVNKAAREQLIPQAEQQAAVGRVMFGLRQDMMRFWHPRVLRPRGEWDWSTEESQRMLMELAKARDAEWTGYNIVRQIVPEGEFTKLESEVRAVHGSPVGREIGVPVQRPVQRSGRTGWSWAAWPVIVVMINLIRMIANHSTDSSPPVRYTPPPQRQVWKTPGGTYERSSASSSSSRPLPGVNAAPGITSTDVDAMQRRFQQSLNDSSSQLSRVMPSSRPQAAAASSMPAVDESLLAISQSHAEERKKQDKAVAFWVDNMQSLDREGYKAVMAVTNDETRRKEIIQDYRKKMYALLGQLHATKGIGLTEQRVLEAIMYERESSYAEIEVVMIQMASVSVPDAYLPVWEDVAELRANVRQVVIQPVAAHVLDKGGEKMFGSDRERLAALAKKPK